MSKIDVTQFVSQAQALESEYGIPASITLGQIILESSGSGTGGFSGLANMAKNLFGIKAGSSWDGVTYTTYTTEEVNGQSVAVKSAFRKYTSWADSIADYGKLLSSSRYTEKTTGVTTVEGYAKALQSAGYATDSKYADKLIEVIKSNNLNQYNTKSWNGSETVSTTSSDTKKTSSWLNFIPIVGTTSTQAEAEGVTPEKIISLVGSGVAVVAVAVIGVVFLMNAFSLNSKGVA